MKIAGETLMEAKSFDAETTHRRFIEIAGDLSPRLAADIASVGPVDILERRGPDLCLFLSRAVIGQQLSTKAARSIWGRMETLMTEAGSGAPRYFLSKNAEILRGCGVSGAKVKTLIAINEAQTAGLLDETVLAAMTPAERAAQLLAIWGVGQWTCDMAAIFYFNDLDIWPEGDVAVRKTFARYIGRKKSSTQARRFAPQRSVLALYMWKIVDRIPTV